MFYAFAVINSKLYCAVGFTKSEELWGRAITKNYLHSSVGNSLLREWDSVDMFKQSDLISLLFVNLSSGDRRRLIFFLEITDAIMKI